MEAEAADPLGEENRKLLSSLDKGVNDSKLDLDARERTMMKSFNRRIIEARIKNQNKQEARVSYVLSELEEDSELENFLRTTKIRKYYEDKLQGNFDPQEQEKLIKQLKKWKVWKKGFGGVLAVIAIAVGGYFVYQTQIAGQSSSGSA